MVFGLVRRLPIGGGYLLCRGPCRCPLLLRLYNWLGLCLVRVCWGRYQWYQMSGQYTDHRVRTLLHSQRDHQDLRGNRMSCPGCTVVDLWYAGVKTLGYIVCIGPSILLLLFIRWYIVNYLSVHVSSFSLYVESLALWSSPCVKYLDTSFEVRTELLDSIFIRTANAAD